MTEEFLISAHFITKALADIDYPISKKELIEAVGEREVKVDWNEVKTIRYLVEPIKIDRFETAASLFSALVAGS
jgi:hypothetical protein